MIAISWFMTRLQQCFVIHMSMVWWGQQDSKHNWRYPPGSLVSAEGFTKALKTQGFWQLQLSQLSLKKYLRSMAESSDFAELVMFTPLSL